MIEILIRIFDRSKKNLDVDNIIIVCHIGFSTGQIWWGNYYYCLLQSLSYFTFKIKDIFILITKNYDSFYPASLIFFLVLGIFEGKDQSTWLISLKIWMALLDHNYRSTIDFIIDNTFMCYSLCQVKKIKSVTD